MSPLLEIEDDINSIKAAARLLGRLACSTRMDVKSEQLEAVRGMIENQIDNIAGHWNEALELERATEKVHEEAEGRLSSVQRRQADVCHWHLSIAGILPHYVTPMVEILTIIYPYQVRRVPEPCGQFGRIQRPLLGNWQSVSEKAKHP